MPATGETLWRVSPARRATTNARVGSPSLPGTGAETSTPIIVARAQTRRLIRVLIDAPRRITYQHSARAINDSASNANVTATNPGQTFVNACRLGARFKRVRASTVSQTRWRRSGQRLPVLRANTDAAPRRADAAPSARRAGRSRWIPAPSAAAARQTGGRHDRGGGCLLSDRRTELSRGGDFESAPDPGTSLLEQRRQAHEARGAAGLDVCR